MLFRLQPALYEVTWTANMTGGNGSTIAGQYSISINIDGQVKAAS